MNGLKIQKGRPLKETTSTEKLRNPSLSLRPPKETIVGWNPATTVTWRCPPNHVVEDSTTKHDGNDEVKENLFRVRIISI